MASFSKKITAAQFVAKGVNSYLDDRMDRFKTSMADEKAFLVTQQKNAASFLSAHTKNVTDKELTTRSYLDNLNNRNKQVGNTGYTDNFKSLRNPSNQAGAFFSYESPQDVIDSVMSLNSKSTPFYNNSIDPGKITYGDTKTFAQPNEITSYIESLSPKDRTYSFGVSENDPNNNYLELANGGLASMFIRGR